eukprot:sb/3463627/
MKIEEALQLFSIIGVDQGVIEGVGSGLGMKPITALSTSARPNIRFGSVRFGKNVFQIRFGSVRWEKTRFGRFLATIMSHKDRPLSPIWDGLIGVGLVCCFFVGVPGNAIAIRYFLKRKRDFARKRPNIRFGSVRFGKNVFQIRFGSVRWEKTRFGRFLATIISSPNHIVTREWVSSTTHAPHQPSYNFFSIPEFQPEPPPLPVPGEETVFPAHVLMAPMPLSSAPIWDGLIGVGLVCCFFVGVPGNAIAIRYFLKRKRDFANTLYTIICVVDIFTSISHFPIAVSLFIDRKPGLFSSLIVCAGWTLTFRFLQKISIFLVMLMSVYRTSLIVYPFRRVHEKSILIALGVFILALIAVDATMVNPKYYKYLSVGPFCVDSPLAGKGDANKGYKFWVTFVKTLTTVELGIPAIISFFSFIICCAKLAQPCPNLFQSERNKKASITVAIFTGIFLFCNLPFFTVMVLNSLTRALGYRYPGPFFKGIFMTHYSWLIAKVFLTVLNASLNPVLYYYRMKKFGVWVRRKSMNGRVKLATFKGVYFSSVSTDHAF